MTKGCVKNLQIKLLHLVEKQPDEFAFEKRSIIFCFITITFRVDGNKLMNKVSKVVFG